MLEQGSRNPIPPPLPAVPVERRIPRGLQGALALTALAWASAAGMTASRAAHGIAVRFQLGSVELLLSAIFDVFLLVVGFRALDWMAARGWQRMDPLSLPLRPGWPREFGLGAALGWGLSLAVALPALVSLNMHARFATGQVSPGPLLTSLATLLVTVLALEVIFRGYPFYRLTAAIGPTGASLLLSFGFAVALLAGNPPHHPLVAILDGVCLGLLLSIAYLRTHALWLGWGLHFAYRAVTALILGLPVAGQGQFGALMDTYVSGPRWLSGGAFGFDSALPTALLLVGAIVVLYRLTRDYAWKYTHREIVAAGYEVTIAPPAAHTAMERAAAPPPLVQILPTTPTTFSRVETVKPE